MTKAAGEALDTRNADLERFVRLAVEHGYAGGGEYFANLSLLIGLEIVVPEYGDRCTYVRRLLPGQLRCG